MKTLFALERKPPLIGILDTPGISDMNNLLRTTSMANAERTIDKAMESYKRTITILASNFL